MKLLVSVNILAGPANNIHLKLLRDSNNLAICIIAIGESLKALNNCGDNG